MSSMQNLPQSNFEYDESSPLRSEEVKPTQKLVLAKESPSFELEVEIVSETRNFERLNLFQEEAKDD